MKKMKLLPILLGSGMLAFLLIYMASPSAAGAFFNQQPAPAAAKPTPRTAEDCGCDVAPVNVGPQLWVTVNGQKFYDTEFNDALAPQLNPLLQKLKDLRVQGVDSLVLDRILQKEAKAAGMDFLSFLRKFVNPKLKEPTDADVNAWIAKNPPQNPADSSSPLFRLRVAAFLKDAQRNDEIKALAESLKKNHRVTLITTANTPDAEGQRVLAMLDEEPIRRSDLDDFLKGQLYELKKQILDIRKQAVDRKIFPILLEAEAKKQSVPVQALVNKEILDKAPMATSPEIEAFYNANRGQIPQPLEQVRGNIANFLRQQAIQQQELRLIAELSKKAQIQYSLPGIIEPVFVISTKGKPSKGAPNAPITIVEFSDYECPYCARIQDTLPKVLALYPDKVRLVAREFPIIGHQYSRKAAQAAQSAFTQGKYFEYTALLYQNQVDLSEPNLMRFAQQVGMDIARLRADLSSGKYDPVIEEDVEEAKRVGLTSTPTFYINGRKLEILSLEGFKEAIDRELSRISNRGTAPTAVPPKPSRD